MKTTLKGIGFFLLFGTAVTLTAFNQDDKNKNAQQQQDKGKGKGQDKGNKGNGKANKENESKPDRIEQKQDKNNDSRGQGNDRGNNGKNNDQDSKGKGNNKNDDEDLDAKERGNSDIRTRKGKHVKGDVYIWDRETFRDRKNLRDGDKVTICHKFDDTSEPAVTIKVSANAQKAHMAHGDMIGECTVTSTNRYSNNFLERRNDYYSTIYETEDQVTYSRSILDYALERLATSRLQLADMQRRNLRAEDIERKQATVVELEENVSLLQTLLGVATNLLVDRL